MFPIILKSFQSFFLLQVVQYFKKILEISTETRIESLGYTIKRTVHTAMQDLEASMTPILKPNKKHQIFGKLNICTKKLSYIRETKVLHKER